jgi:DNA-binding response OmpR family regulator
VTAREFAILRLLLGHPGKVFSQENLFESVWGEDFYGDESAVKMQVSRLRTKLAKAHPGEEYIETLWGMGYRLKG